MDRLLEYRARSLYRGGNIGKDAFSDSSSWLLPPRSLLPLLRFGTTKWYRMSCFDTKSKEIIFSIRWEAPEAVGRWYPVCFAGSRARRTAGPPHGAYRTFATLSCNLRGGPHGAWNDVIRTHGVDFYDLRSGATDSSIRLQNRFFGTSPCSYIQDDASVDPGIPYQSSKRPLSCD